MTRGTLWNAVELALPWELTQPQSVELALAYVRVAFVSACSASVFPGVPRSRTDTHTPRRTTGSTCADIYGKGPSAAG